MVLIDALQFTDPKGLNPSKEGTAMSEVNSQPIPHEASPSPSLLASHAVVSMKSAWSSMSQKTKLIVGAAVAVFVLIIAVIVVSILGAVVSRVFGGGIEAQVSSRGEYVEQQFLRSIDDLKVTKGGREELRLRFTLSSVKGNICGPCRFTVAMADKDGELIHYFNTQSVFQIWSDWRDVDPRQVDLSYQVNPGILRRTRYVEVGIDYP
jgi:hypothetical protein